MALKINYKDEHGIVQIDMSPTSSRDKPEDITDPKFDTINSRFGQYDLFSGKYDVDSGGTPPSLFRSRYNSIEEELANTPYAFATERSLRLNSASNLDITIKSRLDDISPSKDIEDDRFFNRNLNYDGLFGPEIDSDSKIKTDDSPAFTVTQLIHAQDRYFDLSSRQSIVDSPRQSINDSPRSVVKHLRDSFEVRSVPSSGKDRVVKIVDNLSKRGDGAFKVLSSEVKSVGVAEPASVTVVPTSKRKREKSFAILAETPATSRPTSPKSLPVDLRLERVSPFRGRGFREETSRHNTPKTSAANSRASSPPRRRTNSLSKIEKMATATLPPPLHLSRPHSPRNFLKENIEEVREISELNREKHEAAAEKRKIEEEEAILLEMGLSEREAKTEAIKSVVGSRTNSRSNSPNKINLRSRSNSPAAILHYENIPANSKEFINPDDGMPKPVTHKSRVRSMSKSQPQSNDGSPKHSKIPKRQNSVSPNRTGTKRDISISRRPVENNLNRNQRFISNSTSSIHETIKIGSQVHDKRAMSKSTQHLNITPAVKGKPPISPGRGGPPPANKSINSKRLSPIVGTPSKSPIDELKPGSAKTSTKPSLAAKKSVKTAGNTPATSRLNSRQPSRAVSREPSPDKRKTAAKTNSVKLVNGQSKPVTRVPSTKTTQKPSVPSKTEPKKPISRTNSIKSLNRTPSTKNLAEKPPALKKRDSKKDLTEKAQSTTKINEVGIKKDSNKGEKKPQKDVKDKNNTKGSNIDVKKSDSSTEVDEVKTQDNETQYDKITNEKGELVIMTKKSIMSMTTAAITSQPLEVVTTVTNQLPAAFEKAREKGIFERLGSKDSLAPKDDEKETEIAKAVTKEPAEKKEKNEEKVPSKPSKLNHEKVTLFSDDHIKLRPLQPPYNNPQVERVKQKIDDIFKEPEVSIENILTASAKSREMKTTFKNIADKTKNEVKEANEAKDEAAKKLTDIKDQVVKQNEKITAEIRSEVTKIVDSIITPVEEPKVTKEMEKEKNVKENIEPIVMVVNEKKKNGPTGMEKMNAALVKGEAEVEVQSSNVSTPGVDKLSVEKKMDGNGSDKSAQSNGGFPQSTSTTPKPPARTKKEGSKDKSPTNEPIPPPEIEEENQTKKSNICQRLMGKCKSKCCSCCVKGEKDDDEDTEGKKEMEDKRETTDAEAPVEKKGKEGMISKFNCCKKKKEEEKRIEDIERAAGKASIDFEDEVKRKRKLRDVLCGCCGSKRRVSDVSEVVPTNAADIALTPGVVGDTGCCGKKRPQVERRDSILSDRPPTSCCNNRLCTWVRGMTRRRSEVSTSRRQSLFSKNKSMSPTLPPEDTRKKLDSSLVEHTSVMRGAIPVLPLLLATFCLLCNILVPGLGTILSGMFCLCFGIPRFGVHDGAKYRIGAFVINLLVGCGQLFTVLFCLVGWGWSIWWGVIMFRISRKYRKLKAEAAAEEAEAAPPVTNNHTRA